MQRKTPRGIVDPASRPGLPQRVADASHANGWQALTAMGGEMYSLWWTRAQGSRWIDAIRRVRLEALVEHARSASRVYADAYRHVKPGDVRLDALPVMRKPELMARFDDWVTDPLVRKDDVERFIADRDNIGKPFLGKYTVWKSSGTTGNPGIFVNDEDALSRYAALVGCQLWSLPVASQCAVGFLAEAGRAALITATDEHFASIAAWRHACGLGVPLPAKVMSILDPMPDLVAELNAYRPAFVASYPTALELLAEERLAGRLAVQPALLWSGGECLPHASRLWLERVFGCPVINEYGASECLSIGFACNGGRLHLNAEWVILEPVDEAGRPTRAGEPSATVLLTNLANRLQPIIRYDLGDSVTPISDACPCGSPLPGFLVDGRREDIIALRRPDGRIAKLPPLALSTIVEEAGSVHRFQVIQADDDAIAIRLPHDMGARSRARAWNAIADALREYLARNALSGIRVGLDPAPPQVRTPGAKAHEVIALHRQA